MLPQLPAFLPPAMSTLKYALYSVVFAIVVIRLGAALSLRRRRKGLPYPPGPKGKPIIGNALDIPITFQWLKATEWRKEYGVLALHLLRVLRGLTHSATYRRYRVSGCAGQPNTLPQYVRGRSGSHGTAFYDLLREARSHDAE